MSQERAEPSKTGNLESQQSCAKSELLDNPRESVLLPLSSDHYQQYQPLVNGLGGSVLETRTSTYRSPPLPCLPRIECIHGFNFAGSVTGRINQPHHPQLMPMMPGEGGKGASQYLRIRIAYHRHLPYAINQNQSHDFWREQPQAQRGTLHARQAPYFCNIIVCHHTY